jgi:hypothetical protein
MAPRGVQLLYVVARDQIPLYEALTRKYATVRAVGVVLDRRAASGAGPGSGSPDADEAAAERRRRGSLDDRLDSLGYALVRLAGEGSEPGLAP